MKAGSHPRDGNLASDWSVVETLRYFSHIYSDPHFFHNNIIRYCDRPFVDAAHQREEMVRRYNEIVNPDDHVLYLGDLFLPSGREGHEFMNRLNGRKSIVTGNHDRGLTNNRLQGLGFELIEHRFFYTELDEIRVCCCHFPYVGFSSDNRYNDRRPPIEDDVVLIHGHVHAKQRTTWMNTVHAGVDAWDFKPASIDDVSELVKQCIDAKLVNKPT